MDKGILSVIVSLISGYIVAMVLSASHAGVLLGIGVCMLAGALVSFQPRLEADKRELRENYFLSLLAAVVALVIGVVAWLCHATVPAIGFFATTFSSLAVNMTAIVLVNRRNAEEENRKNDE